MKLGFGMTQEQTQKLVMTPELRLAIKVLQLSTVELQEYIEEQLVENPVLETAEEVGEEAGETGDSAPEDRLSKKESERLDIDWEQYFDDTGETWYGSVVNREQEELRFDNFIAEIPTLQSHLLFQLGLAGFNEEEKTVGEFLIGNIDGNGYLECSVDEAAIQCGVLFAAAERVLQIIQGFDPPGVGARNLRECLLIQYEQLNLQDDLLKQIINYHLEEVAAGKAMKVAKKMGVSLNEIQRSIDQLKLLEPKPGRKFSSSEGTRYIVPDVVVEKVDGEYIILVNDISAPRLTVNPVYREIIRGNQCQGESRKYVESKLNSALWLIKSIEQRRVTLYRVARCIVDFQRDFFERGIKFLQPMNLKRVAEFLGVHESTVSRATANKYMQSPRGVFDMKFFFSSGVANTQGTMTSAEAVKKMIRELVENEDQRKPLSDQKIAGLLQDRGVDISRRTVAKYRDEIGIFPISQRRRY